MRIFCLAAVACLSLMGAACATTDITNPGTSPPPITAENTVIDEKAAIAAELAYITAAEAFVTARDRQLVSPEVLATARAHLIRSYDALKLAREARRALNARSFAEQAAIVVSAAGDVRRLLPSSP